MTESTDHGIIYTVGNREFPYILSEGQSYAEATKMLLHEYDQEDFFIVGTF